MEPSIGNGFYGKIRTFIISHHNVWSFAQYLAILRYFYFNAIDQRPHGAEHPVLFIKPVHGYYGRCFSKPITFHYDDLRRGKYPDQSHLAGGASGYNAGNIIAERFAPF